MILPFKTAILKYIVEHKEDVVSTASVMEGMKDTVYAKESQFNPKRVTGYIDAYGQCGFLKKEHVEINSDGTIDISYRVTDAGIARAQRFIPGVK